MIRKSVLLAAGAVGIGAGTGVANAGTPARAPAPTTLELHGQGWHIDVRGRRFGQLPAAGDRANVYGELFDRPGGARLGEFTSAWIHTQSPFGEQAHGAGSLELHTFRLGDSSLFGLGSAGAGQGAFAIVGGTGRYAGARGSYVARQSPRGTGGDGTAHFTLTLIG